MKVLLQRFNPLSVDHDPEEYWHHGGHFETVAEYENAGTVSLTAQGLSIDGVAEAIRIKSSGAVALRLSDVVYETLDDEIEFNAICIEEESIS